MCVCVCVCKLSFPVRLYVREMRILPVHSMRATCFPSAVCILCSVILRGHAGCPPHCVAGLGPYELPQPRLHDVSLEHCNETQVLAGNRFQLSERHIKYHIELYYV